MKLVVCVFLLLSLTSTEGTLTTTLGAGLDTSTSLTTEGSTTASSTADPHTSTSLTTEGKTSPLLIATTTEECEDQVDCKSSKDKCAEPAWVEMMSKICKKTCGYCGENATPMPCVDANPACPMWVENGFCTNPFFTKTTKEQNCAKSCGLCK